ncbi:membrane protein insertion efficiency factor YidD [Candidatus Binatia bacterium]|nr:membrane protein insertion efficiency factor YidD [Candidatus Binatia bacterium]
MSSSLSILMRGLLRGYQLVLSPLLGPACRFAPSCSEYAREAIALHGPGRGAWLALRRLSRCHPLGGAGFDPVPEPPHRPAGALAHSSRSDA